MNNRTIVHVEDNYHNRRIVRKILTTQGYQIHEAEDGLAGWQMIKDVVPDLILLDISLPGIDGLEIVRRLRDSETFQNIPVIALTASAMVGDRERFLAAGCDDYLSKPVRALTLIQRVNSYLT